jgi:hypothetical protein
MISRPSAASAALWASWAYLWVHPVDPFGRRRRASGAQKNKDPRSCLEREGWAPPLTSQGLQELDDGFLVGASQFFKLLNDVAGLAAVPRDGFEER